MGWIFGFALVQWYTSGPKHLEEGLVGGRGKRMEISFNEMEMMTGSENGSLNSC